MGTRKKGRPTKLTKALVGELADILRGGNFVAAACAKVGISKALFYQWCDKGKAARERSEAGEGLTAEQSSFLEFLDTVEEARADAEIDSVRLLKQAAEHGLDGGDLRALTFFLERGRPDHWGNRGRAQVEVTAKVEHKVDFEQLTAEQAAQAYREIVGNGSD